jgi:hypothetical protein
MALCSLYTNSHNHITLCLCATDWATPYSGGQNMCLHSAPEIQWRFLCLGNTVAVHVLTLLALLRGKHEHHSEQAQRHSTPSKAALTLPRQLGTSPSEDGCAGQ